jgi:hypothetical protein
LKSDHTLLDQNDFLVDLLGSATCLLVDLVGRPSTQAILHGLVRLLEAYLVRDAMGVKGSQGLFEDVERVVWKLDKKSSIASENCFLTLTKRGQTDKRTFFDNSRSAFLILAMALILSTGTSLGSVGGEEMVGARTLLGPRVTVNASDWSEKIVNNERTFNTRVRSLGNVSIFIT